MICVLYFKKSANLYSNIMFEKGKKYCAFNCTNLRNLRIYLAFVTNYLLTCPTNQVTQGKSAVRNK